MKKDNILRKSYLQTINIVIKYRYKGGTIMEYLKKVFEKSGWISILESLVFAILGAILIANPEGTVKFIAYILGIIFIGVGVYKVGNYFASKGQNDFYNNDLIFGIMAGVIGIITIAYSSAIGSVLRIIIGIWIIYSSLIRIGLASKLKSQEKRAWGYSLVLALIMLACGLYITLQPGAIIVTIGVMMIISSVIDIIEDIIFMRNIKEIL